jgi:hypothetical protein
LQTRKNSYRKITVRGEHKNWDEYRDTMQKEKRVIIRVKIEKVGPQRARER